ncbi:MAG: glycosyltransferase family 2 protein [Cyanobacteria bacterium P01_C01_bin.118]
MTYPRVAAVVPTYNRWCKTQRFLKHFMGQTYGALTIVVVDASSPDGTAERIQQDYGEVTVLQVDDQQFWAGATNAGVRYALNQGYDYIFTINDDAVVAPDHVASMVDLAQRYDADILGNRIDYLAIPGMIWALGTQLVWGTPKFLQLQYHGIPATDLSADVLSQEMLAVDALPGNGVLIHRCVFEQVGLYQDRFLPHYHADSELILRAGRQGFQAYVAPRIVLQDDFAVEQKQQDLRSLAGLRYAFLNRKSHLYVFAIAYILLRYCPWYAYLQTAYYLLKRLIGLSKGRPGSEGLSGS